MKPFTKKIVLENGREFFGYGFGADRETINQVVFNTAVVGYQELISDPTYTDQMVVMTYPLIGNYGLADEDYETKNITVGGLIVRDYNDTPSNFRYTRTLNEVLEEQGIPAITGIDTRMLTRIIRDEGSQKMLLTDVTTSHEEAMRKIKEYELPENLIEKVSCKKRWFSRTPNHRFDVVVMDCGIKHSTIRCFNQRGCNVTVVPYTASVEEILAFRPDGLFLSSGPGAPEHAQSVIDRVKALKGRLPIFGIGLGHLIISLAYGAKVVKMKFDHRGINHPVRSLEDNRISITSQSHSYAVNEASLKNTDLEVTHVDVLDGTVEGVAAKSEPTFSVQFHPESAAGQQYSVDLFDKFIKMMEEHKNA